MGGFRRDQFHSPRLQLTAPSKSMVSMPVRVLPCVLMILLSGAGLRCRAEEPELFLIGSPLKQKLGARVRFSCTDTPLRKALYDLGQANRVAVFLDRRVDPSTEISLVQDKPPLWEVFRSLAACGSAECGLIGNVVYVGPKGSPEVLAMAAALRRADVRRLPEPARKRLLKPLTLSWPPLATPVGLFNEWESRSGINAQQVRTALPHDLWAEGTFPTMVPTDIASLLAIGFDTTFRFSEDGTAILPEPLPPASRLRERAPRDAVDQALSPVLSEPRRELPDVPRAGQPPSDPFVRERFTLTVRSQPLAAVVEQLARRLELEVVWADDSPPAVEARRRIRCSFAVKDANLDSLLKAMLADTPYTFSRNGARVEIRSPDK